MSEKHTLGSLADRIRAFSLERDWDQFHSPKNLAMAMVSEVGELVEHFQWLTEEQSRHIKKEKLPDIEEELADVLIYLVRLADKLDVDLIAVANKKIDRNAEKYPVEKARGSAKKYTEL